MSKHLLILVVLAIALNACQGCSFIKEHFAKKQINQAVEQEQQQPQEQPQKKVEPIPVNPQHS